VLAVIDARVSRRKFVSGAGGLTAAVMLAPDAMAWWGRRGPTLRGGQFAEGVLSGDPTPNGITLWTRVADVEHRGSVELQVAKDPEFRRVVARDFIETGSWNAHSVKARVTRLRPYEQYYYRFSTRDETSPVGRFRTALPPDSNQPVRFAFFSCQDFTFGYYTAHALLAQEDVDFVLNLGDYIYAEAYHSAGSPSGGVRTDPVGESITLDQYRGKYATYRSDANLRQVHSQFPMISIWDDHEVVDNYAGGAGDTGGLAPELKYSLARKDAGYRAFFESMPTYGYGYPGNGSRWKRPSRIYRSMRFGRNVDLILLDERQYRADQPCGDPFLGPACEGLEDPRNFLGPEQLDWTKRRLSSSSANWKVLANQVMIERTYFPSGDIINFDSWMGYPYERAQLLGHIRDKGIKDVVFVTGDIHTFVAGDVRFADTDTTPVATEFVGGSITSQGLGEGGGGVLPGADPFNPKTPTGVILALQSVNPWVKNADFDHHGYGLAEATEAGFACQLKRVAGIKTPTSSALPVGEFQYQVARGNPSILG
jgi:alkaline phosphatase D